jgi:hypothetical protein
MERCIGRKADDGTSHSGNRFELGLSFRPQAADAPPLGCVPLISHKPRQMPRATGAAAGIGCSRKNRSISRAASGPRGSV